MEKKMRDFVKRIFEILAQEGATLLHFFTNAALLKKSSDVTLYIEEILHFLEGKIAEGELTEPHDESNPKELNLGKLTGDQIVRVIEALHGVAPVKRSLDLEQQLRPIREQIGRLETTIRSQISKPDAKQISSTTAQKQMEKGITDDEVGSMCVQVCKELDTYCDPKMVGYVAKEFKRHDLDSLRDNIRHYFSIDRTKQQILRKAGIENPSVQQKARARELAKEIVDGGITMKDAYHSFRDWLAQEHTEKKPVIRAAKAIEQGFSESAKRTEETRLQEMTYKQLQAKAKKLGIPAVGKKDDLIKAILIAKAKNQKGGI